MGKLFDKEILILYLMVKTIAYSHKISTQYIHRGKGLLQDTEKKIKFSHGNTYLDLIN